MADRKVLSREAQVVIDRLVVQEGRSYEDAIRRAREMGHAASRPYLEAATEIQRWLDEINQRAKERVGG